MRTLLHCQSNVVSVEMKFLLLIVLFACFSLSLCDDTVEIICNTDKDCQPFHDKMVESICVESMCQCKNIKTHKKESCLPKKLSVNNMLLSDCRQRTCGIPHSICDVMSVKCICDKGFVESPDHMRCLTETVHLSQPCEMNEQCVRFDMNSYCSNGTCHCLSNFTQYDESCRSLVKIGEHCNSTDECHKFNDNASCIDHKCVCDKDFVSSENGDVCLPVRYHHEDCQQDSQCLNGLGVGSMCDNGKCICTENHQNNSNDSHVICLKKVRHGDSCSEHSDCVYYMKEPAMECFQTRCRCRDGYELFDAYDKQCVAQSKSSSQSSSIVVTISAISLLVMSHLFSFV